jgi:Mn2+ and Fe2+ transporters of the NRAMP family
MPQTAQTESRSLGKKISELGPTWLAGAIAAGPASMGALLTGGASFGYALLWVVVISALFGALAQYLATKLAVATGEGLVETVERRLGEKWAWLLVADVVLVAGFAQLIIMKTVASVSGLLTPFSANFWGIAWAVILAAGLAGGGYRIAELGAKVVVTAVVLAFIASLFVVPVDPSAATGGLVPSIPTGGAIATAGILGGAVHITIITMQTYTVKARGWTRDDIDLARFDISVSMLVAFGIFSIAAFLVAAGALFGNVDGQGLRAIAAASALEPIAGGFAKQLFLIGLLGAAVSTLGGNTLVAPYVAADKLGWETDVSDSRYRALLAGTALLSGGGVFIGGAFLGQLVLVLAVGTVGTPFALALVLVLLNDPETVGEAPSAALNLGGVLVFGVASVLAGNFVIGQLNSGLSLLSGSVLAFAGVIAVATLVLLGSHLRTRMTDANTVAVSE